jgi:hypothetical protein
MEGELSVIDRAVRLIRRAYIRGHPMWTPLAKGLATETGVPVFGQSLDYALAFR